MRLSTLLVVAAAATAALLIAVLFYDVNPFSGARVNKSEIRTCESPAETTKTTETKTGSDFFATKLASWKKHSLIVPEKASAHLTPLLPVLMSKEDLQMFLHFVKVGKSLLFYFLRLSSMINSLHLCHSRVRLFISNGEAEDPHN